LGIFSSVSGTEGLESTMAFVDKTVEVAADVRDVYDAWTAFEDYPEFMDVVERVDVVQADQCHWVMVVEDEIVEWDADITEHVPEQSVSWRAIDGRETGQVKFDKIDTGRTRIHYQLEYDASGWDQDPDKLHTWMQQRVTDDLQAFKEAIEAV
jgi:uncharacterized membrane protein